MPAFPARLGDLPRHLRDGIVFSDGGEFDGTREVTSGVENAVFTSVDGTILNEINAVYLSHCVKHGGHFCVR